MGEYRKCRKCGQHIPNRMMIEGKVRVLHNRKFCLECSPFRKHNTRANIDEPKKNRRRKYTIHYANKRGIERKKKLVELAGGQCISCGYNKCYRALSFHHRERETKNFPLSMNILWSIKWELILEEFVKCDLLCLNCHAELEQDFEEKRKKSAS